MLSKERTEERDETPVLVSVKFVAESIDFELRPDAEVLNKVCIFASVDGLTTDEGEPCILTNPVFDFDCVFDLDAPDAEHKVLEGFYNHPRLQEVMDYYRKRFSHILER